MVYMIIVLAVIMFISFLFATLVQMGFVNKLKERNEALFRYLVSKNGIDINVYNFRFGRYMFKITDETDPVLKKWKKAFVISLSISGCCLLLILIIKSI